MTCTFMPLGWLALFTVAGCCLPMVEQLPEGSFAVAADDVPAGFEGTDVSLEIAGPLLTIRYTGNLGEPVEVAYRITR